MLDILMACYNNEKYVAEQLESIMKQTFAEWRLIIQDDQSTDNTYSILQTYQTLHPDKIIIKQNTSNSGGAKNNFISMLPLATAHYVMFSDGDDYWLPEKIQKTLDIMKDAEASFGAEIPILVHTDLEVVDKDLKTIAKSLFGWQKLDPDRTSFNQLMVQNVVTGCTCMMNRKLFDLTVCGLSEKQGEPLDAIVMHDWWIALTAAAFGRISCVREATILYRQHGGNSVGAKNVQSMDYFKDKIKNRKNLRHVLEKTFLQAKAFEKAYLIKLPSHIANMLNQYDAINQSGKIKKIVLTLRYGFLKKGLIRAIGQLLYM